MKRLILYLILIVLLAFLLPMFLTKRFISEQTSVSVENEVGKDKEQESLKNYEYTNYGEVNILHAKNNEIETMKLDDYLLGVVSAEMPVNFEEEALKAQAIVARTYTIYTIKNSGNKHGEAQMCDDSTCCQAWISKEDRMEKWSEEEIWY